MNDAPKKSAVDLTIDHAKTYNEKLSDAVYMGDFSKNQMSTCGS